MLDNALDNDDSDNSSAKTEDESEDSEEEMTSNDDFDDTAVDEDPSVVATTDEGLSILIAADEGPSVVANNCEEVDGTGNVVEETVPLGASANMPLAQGGKVETLEVEIREDTNRGGQGNRFGGKGPSPHQGQKGKVNWNQNRNSHFNNKGRNNNYNNTNNKNKNNNSNFGKGQNNQGAQNKGPNKGPNSGLNDRANEASSTFSDENVISNENDNRCPSQTSSTKGHNKYQNYQKGNQSNQQNSNPNATHIYNQNYQNQKGGGGNNNNNNNNKNQNQKDKKKDEPIHSPKDILKLAKAVISPFWNKRSKPEPVDSLILKLHYRMSVCIFVLAFVIVQSNWYLRESIKCMSAHYSSREDLPFHLHNFCLSFSYICDMSLAEADDVACHRRYLLFYRWSYISFLLISVIYYIPRFVAKRTMNPRLARLLFDLHCSESRYDNASSQMQIDRMVNFIYCERGTKSQYLWLILCHGIALAIDLAVVYFFNFILHNRFIGLLYHAYPLHRDPRYFTDYLSQTFPPFVNCTIEKEHLVNVEREETFGCYLYLMELYDKVFVILWMWLSFLVVVTTLVVVCLFLLSSPLFKPLFLFLFTSSSGISKIKRKVCKVSDFSDLYVLYLLKQHQSEGQFIKLLSALVHSHQETLEEVVVTSVSKESKEKGGGVLNVHWAEDRREAGQEDLFASGNQPMTVTPSAPQY